MSRARKSRHKVSGDDASMPPPKEGTVPSASTELLPLILAAQELFTKLSALCVARSASAQIQPWAVPRKPYYTEEEVAVITGMSVEWFQRARREKIGPRVVGIARNVRYPHNDLMSWIESGTAAREHLISRSNKKGKKPAKTSENNGSVSDSNDESMVATT